MGNRSISVLLADDDEDDRYFFKQAFTELKLQINLYMVNDGVELMNYLTTTTTELPDMLFLDLNMPRKSGLECLKEIKSNEYFKNITVAIYSTSAAERDIEQTFIEGANIYIKKPNNFKTLKKVLKKAVTMEWQYHTSFLKRETYMLNFSE